VTHTDQLLYHEINYQDPLLIFNIFVNENWSMFLDSADSSKVLNNMNRYSFIVFDPFIKITYNNSIITCNDVKYTCTNPFEFLRTIFQNYSFQRIPGLPPFQGGAVGYFSYDLCHFLEKVQYPKHNDMNFDDMAIGIYDTVISFDHKLKKAWIVSSGFSETNSAKQKIRATERINSVVERISIYKPLPSINFCPLTPESITSNFSEEFYINTVKKVIEYIRSGDIFEANLSQRFQAVLPSYIDPFQLYIKVRKKNPSPFASYIKVNETIIASTSPERFLLLKDSIVETRPIKGTCARSSNSTKDYILAQTLKNSIKDNAENVMIVDLMRNDLSKICEDGSISVPQLCGLETFVNVHHLVSVVTGKIKPQFNSIDLLEACFPGGSITGAPKIRSMQIISELESYRRGAYCGSIGYIGFDNSLDTSIVIRTYVIKGKFITFNAGGAIVIDSDPVKEYQETIVKAQALLNVLLNEE
jgi:para-aminobenzoate synthetase component 1